MPQHTHRYKPTWVLLTSPAWLDGYHRIVAHAICLVCREETYLSAWQSPAHLAGRRAEEGEA